MLRAQGALSISPRGCWRLGWLDLQGSTFTFHGSGRHAAVKIDLAAITGLDRERRTFILVSKHVLRLTYRPAAAARRRMCWLITARLDDWEVALGQRLAGRPAEAPAAELPAPVSRRLAARLTGLPATSALILDYLACRGHATTAELMTLIGAETEEALLAEMHAGFRQLAPVLGGPAVRYADRYFDAASREVRQQTWRIGEKVAARLAGIPRSDRGAHGRRRTARDHQPPDAGTRRAAIRPCRRRRPRSRAAPRTQP